MDPYRREATVFRALAHPVRLRILEALARREACVCHLTAMLGQRQPYVSQQLAALREAGLVTDRREGTLVYYSLRDQRLAALLAVGADLAGSRGGRRTASAATGADDAVPGCSCPTCAATGNDDDPTPGSAPSRTSIGSPDDAGANMQSLE